MSKITDVGAAYSPQFVKVEMSDKLKAAAQAVLESTKSLSVCCEDFSHRPQDLHDDGECPPWRRYNDALAALEAALAKQTVQKSLTVAEPEPVGKFSQFSDGVWKEVTASSPGISLYSAPPRREWVSLTDEEISAVDWKSNETLHDFSRAIEAKLRIKNGY